MPPTPAAAVCSSRAGEYGALAVANAGKIRITRYLWGPAVDQILAEEAVNGGADETVQWTLTDHLNTVRDIAKYDSQPDTTAVVNHLVYDAFGRVTSETGPAVDSRSKVSLRVQRLKETYDHSPVALAFLFTARLFPARLLHAERTHCKSCSSSPPDCFPPDCFMLRQHRENFARGAFGQDTQLQNNLNRWYDARVGRWLSEDPVGFDAGDGNLYRYGLAPLVTTDPFGLQENKPDPLAVYGVPAGWVGWELTLAGRTLIRIGDEQFYVSGKPQPGMWVPRSGSTSSLFIYRKGHPNDVFRLDYHPLADTAGRPVWHYNTTRKLAKVRGLTRGSFGSTNHAVTIGSRATGQLITIFRYGGAALFVVGGGMSAYEVYKADNQAREATRQVGGLAGAIVGARIGSWTGIKVGTGAAAIAGQAGPQVGAPEELVTVILGYRRDNRWYWRSCVGWLCRH